MAEDTHAPLLTLAEMCSRYKVSDRRARDIVRQHRVPVLQPGRRWLFDVRAEMAFREACRLYPVRTVEPARGQVTASNAARSAYSKALALASPGPLRRGHKTKK